MIESKNDVFKVGDQIERQIRITITGKIAEGGMGEVYEAILHGAVGYKKRVAVKVVRSELQLTGDQDEDIVQFEKQAFFLLQLVDEAKLVSDLIHTHIAQIYFMHVWNRDEDDASGFVVMEYVNGVNLKSFIDKHVANGIPMPVEIAVYIASRVARALEYAHNHKDKAGKNLGIVHRDVTPSNVMIYIEGVVKLTDFGIAQAVHQHADSTGMVVGKEGYMAPEQRRGEAVDAGADIFSLGLMLFELLAGRLAEPATPERKIESISSDRKDVSEEVEKIIQSCTCWERKDRYANMSTIAWDMEHIIYGSGKGPTFVELADYLKELFPSLCSIHTTDESTHSVEIDKTIIGN
ncbi:MAG: serine/threonine protein kinase [Candidatus Lindowbacteria bacterium]|nr:serine/threonine protein kinase [Candidatus Lindowbacteria bacterium]